MSPTDPTAPTEKQGERLAELAAKYPLLDQLARFGSVGLISNAIYYAALPLLTETEFSPPFGAKLGLSSAAAVAYAISMVANYLLQRRVTFKSQRRHREALTRYLVVQGVALTLNAALLEVLVTRLGIAYLIGQGVALVATMSWNYIAQRLWVFWARPTPHV